MRSAVGLSHFHFDNHFTTPWRVYCNERIFLAGGIGQRQQAIANGKFQHVADRIEADNVAVIDRERDTFSPFQCVAAACWIPLTPPWPAAGDAATNHESMFATIQFKDRKSTRLNSSH